MTPCPSTYQVRMSTCHNNIESQYILSQLPISPCPNITVSPYNTVSQYRRVPIEHRRRVAHLGVDDFHAQRVLDDDDDEQHCQRELDHQEDSHHDHQHRRRYVTVRQTSAFRPSSSAFRSSANLFLSVNLDLQFRHSVHRLLLSVPTVFGTSSSLAFGIPTVVYSTPVVRHPFPVLRHSVHCVLLLGLLVFGTPSCVFGIPTVVWVPRRLRMRAVDVDGDWPSS